MRRANGIVSGYSELATFLLSVEQRQGNHTRLRNVARIVDVQMVATVVVRTYLGRMVWVPHRRVEIDDGIESAAVEYPGVDLLTNRFSLVSVEGYSRFPEE